MEVNTVPEALDDFANNATIHGAPRSIGSKTKCTCVWWGLVFCLALGAFCFQFGNLVSKYLDYPTSVSLEYEVDNAKFPWVTLCSANPFSLVAVELDKTLLNRVATYDDDTVTFLTHLANISTSIDNFQFLDGTLETATQKKYLPLNSFFGKDLIQKYALEKEKFIVLCKFKGKECNVTRAFQTYLHAKYYNCFTFRHENEKASAGLENGLSFVVFNNLGTTNPLNFIIREVRKDSVNGRWFDPRSDLSGSLMVVHAPNTLPHFEKDGISILPGQHVQVKTNSIIAKREKTPKKRCTEKNRTIDGVEIQESLYNCQQVCLQEGVVSNCKCYDPELIRPQDPQISPCMSDFYERVKALKKSCEGVDNKTCADKIKPFYFYSQCPSDTRAIFDYSECDCHQPCKESSYETSTTNEPWPQTIVNSVDVNRYGIISEIFNFRYIDHFTDAEWDFLQQNFWEDVNQFGTNWISIHLNKQKEILSNFALVEVYFADTNVRASNEERSYGFVDLLADMGGTLGLWIGMSVISAVEICYLFVSLIHVCCKRKGTQINVKTAST